MATMVGRRRRLCVALCLVALRVAQSSTTTPRRVDLHKPARPDVATTSSASPSSLQDQGVVLAASPRPLREASAANVTAVTKAAQGALEHLHDALEVLRHAGPLGHLAIVASFTIWVWIALPITPVEIAIGFIFGPMWGFVCNLFCKTLGSAGAFLTAQQLGRRRGWKMPGIVRSRLPLLRTKPVLTMIGLRLLPVPLVVKNYGLGLCEVRLSHFLVATIAVDIPPSAIWATVGGSSASLSDALTAHHSLVPAIVAKVVSWRFLPVILVLVLSLLIFLIWHCRQGTPVHRKKQELDFEQDDVEMVDV